MVSNIPIVLLVTVKILLLSCLCRSLLALIVEWVVLMGIGFIVVMHVLGQILFDYEKFDKDPIVSFDIAYIVNNLASVEQKSFDLSLGSHAEFLTQLGPHSLKSIVTLVYQ